MDLSHLSLMQMSFSGAVFILVIIVVRAMAINRLPKKMFLILWSIALLRLLIPLSVPSVVSIYSVIGRVPISIQKSSQPTVQLEYSEQLQAQQSDLSQQSQPLQQPSEQLYPSQTEQMQLQQLQPSQETQSQQNGLPLSSPAFAFEQLQLQPQQETGHVLNVSVWFIVRCVGTVICAFFFAASYLKWSLRFRASIPVHNDYVEQWLDEHMLKRPICIKQSDRTATPLTYGIFRPVILLPNKTDWENTEQLQYVLLHEYVHIRRFDIVTKFVTMIALCVHWFNPLVWVMYVLFNRDLELSCDESVVRLLGLSSKSDYARVLISMEAKKSGLMPLYNNFSRNAIEERIKSIMKIRKTSLFAILAAVIVVVGLTAVFVTSARSANIGSFKATVNSQLLQYMDMTYGQFKEQAGVEAESYHAHYFTASIPDTEADIVFEGAYDEELGGPVLADDDRVFRIEGKLGTIVSGITGEMKGAELVIALAETTGIVATGVNEGGGTAYYVADNFIETSIDLNGDNIADASLQITLDESGNVGPDSYTWLVSFDSPAGSANEEYKNDSQDAENIPEDLVLNIRDFYTTNIGDPSNLYYIDENKVLWGCGRNNYGQLGQGTQDYDFHKEMVKIAENVIHVDYSQSGFTVYLTEDHRLYGMGNAGCGALQQYEQFYDTQWMLNGGYDNYAVTTPCLLMENVIYARCGRDDVVCLDEDNNVWIWGMIGYDRYPVTEIYFESKPIKVLEKAVLVTGGLFNHAALLADGSVWTWGYNYVGNCGVPNKIIVEEPMRVAEDAVMVWTGITQYNIDCQDITEFGGVYEGQFENTIILKRDGSYWACGANVGNEEKILAQYWGTSDYPVVCSFEFLPYEIPKAAFESNYYHSVSAADETSVYLGGAGGIYEINRFVATTIYPSPHIAGAALYKDYVYSIEYNVTDQGMTADLIRIKKDGSDKKVLTQISTGSYDLRIIDNILVITEQILGDYGLETIFYSYTLDNEGNLISDTSQDAYTQFELPDGYEDGMCFLINPWFSTTYLGYTCFIKGAGVMDTNSVWISRGNQEALEEVVTCSGEPLLTKDAIFYCDSNGATLIQRSLSNMQETVLYEIPDTDSLSLLTYDSEWVYFIQKPATGEYHEVTATIMRVNLQDHKAEKVYELYYNYYMSNFNVYGNNSYFILTDAETTQWIQWIQYDLISGEVVTIDMDADI